MNVITRESAGWHPGAAGLNECHERIGRMGNGATKMPRRSVSCLVPACVLPDLRCSFPWRGIRYFVLPEMRKLITASVLYIILNII